jgi:hypothetical protein
MGHIFISYSRRDAQFVDVLRSRLESNGIQVWLDRTDIQGGSKWRSEIVDAIERAEVILIILSRHSMQSDNVRKELDIAEGQKAKIIPVEIEPVETPSDFKYQLAGLQQIKIGNNFEAGFSQLLDALRKSSKSHQSIKSQTQSTYVQENYRSIIHKYAQLINEKNVYFLSAIPEKTLASVYKHYARNALALSDIPLCLVDHRNLNSGKYGLLITNQTLYWRDSALSSGKSLALKSIITIEPIPLLGGLRINDKTKLYIETHTSNLKMIAAMVQELARL